MTLAVLVVAFFAAVALMLIAWRGTQRPGRRHHVASDGTMAFGDGGSDCGSDGGGGCGDGGGGGGD